MKRRAHSDPVSPETYGYVVARDDYNCVAPRLGATDQCRDRWGEAWYSGSGYFSDQILTLDHVKAEPMLGKRGPSRPDSLVTLCWHHHLNSGWATSHRPELRAYLRSVNGDRAGRAA